MTTSGRSFHLLAVQEVCISNLRKGMNRSERIAAFQVLTVMVISFGKQKVLKFLDYLINPFLADFSILHILKTPENQILWVFFLQEFRFFLKAPHLNIFLNRSFAIYCLHNKREFFFVLIIKPKKKT